MRDRPEHSDGCVGYHAFRTQDSVPTVTITVFLMRKQHAVTVSQENRCVAVLFTGQMPFLSPNQQRHSTEGRQHTYTHRHVGRHTYKQRQQYSAAREFSRRAAEFGVCHGICCLRNCPFFATFISNARFFGLPFTFTIYKMKKASRCNLWFCALAPSAKITACSLCCVF